MKSATRNQTEVTSRMNVKMFNGNNLPRGLATRQKAKLRNAFGNKISTWYKVV